MAKGRSLPVMFFVLFAVFSCSLPLSKLETKSPHDEYADRLKNAELHQSHLGKEWLLAANKSLSEAAVISLPFKETGYFDGTEVRSVAFAFTAKRGERIYSRVESRSLSGCNLFVDLYALKKEKVNSYEVLESTDSTGNILTHDVNDNDTFLIRLQPELLCSSEYTITIYTGPSLGFPVQGKSNIGSFYGDTRDMGARSHEGIDIFAERRTPAVASSAGLIVQVNENNLGGKTVWLRVNNKNYTLYYAHLDTQLVNIGQRVREGDTIGLVGNTGNAKYTSPHLHFGIYTGGATVDPLPYVKKTNTVLPEITADLSRLNKNVKTRIKNQKVYSSAAGKMHSGELPVNTVMKVIGAASSRYKVAFPDNTHGYISAGSVTDIESGIQKIKNKKAQPLYSNPDTLAPRKTYVSSGEIVYSLGIFGNFEFVRNDSGSSGYILKAQ